MKSTEKLAKELKKLQIKNIFKTEPLTNFEVSKKFWEDRNKSMVESIQEFEQIENTVQELEPNEVKELLVEQK